MTNIEVLDDPAEAVADLLVQARGDIVLTGGSSPERAYELAAARRDDWSGVTVWFTDERCVPPDHELSNFAMVERTLLARPERPPDCRRMPGELGPERGADAYEAELADTRLELVLLGLGPDAHIASLFPGKPEKHVTDRPVVGVPEAGMEPYVPRISLTLPAINAARQKIFLVTGASKREAVQRAFGDEPDPESPGAHVRPVTVYLDAAAAGR
ncbi:MAG TPA: 6-phosphogluconolactonase [Solirubrobacteraceae bacterium]|nr:6-phosphogluconolactonase [Solirubrobacteraceae bacterium]